MLMIDADDWCWCWCRSADADTDADADADAEQMSIWADELLLMLMPRRWTDDYMSIWADADADAVTPSSNIRTYTRRSVSSSLKQSFLTPNWLVINDYSYFYKKNFFVTICVVSLDNALNSVMLLIPGTMLHSTCWIIIEMFNLSSIGIWINI